ncbi:hypothetical protein KI387_003451, partial [Taxus chinensis]
MPGKTQVSPSELNGVGKVEQVVTLPSGAELIGDSKNAFGSDLGILENVGILKGMIDDEINTLEPIYVEGIMSQPIPPMNWSLPEGFDINERSQLVVTRYAKWFNKKVPEFTSASTSSRHEHSLPKKAKTTIRTIIEPSGERFVEIARPKGDRLEGELSVEDYEYQRVPIGVSIASGAGIARWEDLRPDVEELSLIYKNLLVTEAVLARVEDNKAFEWFTSNKCKINALHEALKELQSMEKANKDGPNEMGINLGALQCNFFKFGSFDCSTIVEIKEKFRK